MMLARKPLRIAFPFAGDQFGGSSVSSILLARALRARGHSVEIIVHGEGRMAKAVRDGGFDPIALPALAKTASDDRRHRFRPGNLAAIGACRRAAKSLELDIVHVNDLAMLRLWAIPARLSGANFVTHWRSNYVPSISVGLALRSARLVIAISQYSHDRLPAWVQRKTVTEYNPFEARTFSSTDRAAKRRERRAELGIDERSILVGVFGTLIKRKRANTLADVLHAIPELDGVPVVGAAFGKRAVPYDELLDEKVEAFGLQHRLLRPGLVTPATDWMAACDLILAPAEREPFGRIPFEALQAGTPVIMSSDSGAAELLLEGTTGLLVDPDDTDAWIARTREMLRNPALGQAIVENARNMLAELAPERHAARIEALYASALERRL